LDPVKIWLLQNVDEAMKIIARGEESVEHHAASHLPLKLDKVAAFYLSCGSPVVLLGG